MHQLRGTVKLWTNHNEAALKQSMARGAPPPTSWLKMADENETALMPEKEDVEDHGHCSDCENEEHHLDDG